jgi:uncharacterized membrane protein
MKLFAKVAVAGISGVVLFKLFATILFPLLGLLFGLLAMTVKLAVIAAVAFFVYSMIRKRKAEAQAQD